MLDEVIILAHLLTWYCESQLLLQHNNVHLGDTHVSFNHEFPLHDYQSEKFVNMSMCGLSHIEIPWTYMCKFELFNMQEAELECCVYTTFKLYVKIHQLDICFWWYVFKSPLIRWHWSRTNDKMDIKKCDVHHCKFCNRQQCINNLIWAFPKRLTNKT